MKMRSRPSTLTLVSLYAIIATIVFSHHLIRDVSLQLKQSNQIDDGVYYSRNFSPATHTANNNKQQQQYHNVSLPSTTLIATDTSIDSRPMFPIKTHIVTQGKPRTATTLLFNMVAVSYFLYLAENDPSKIPNVKLIYWQRPSGYKTLREEEDITYVIKAHITLDNFFSKNTVVFTAAVDTREAKLMKRRLTRHGHTVAFVQDLESVKAGGITKLVDEYVDGYGLSEKDRTNLNEYFSSWEILRQCCGQQMSARWRNDMMPEKFKIRYVEIITSK